MCDADDGELALFLVTNCQNGDTLAACPGHFIVWAQTMLQAMAPDPQDGGRAEATGGAQAPEEVGEGPSPPRRKRGQSRRQADSGEAPDTVSPFPDIPPDDL